MTKLTFITPRLFKIPSNLSSISTNPTSCNQTIQNEETWILKRVEFDQNTHSPYFYKQMIGCGSFASFEISRVVYWGPK